MFLVLMSVIYSKNSKWYRNSLALSYFTCSVSSKVTSSGIRTFSDLLLWAKLLFVFLVQFVLYTWFSIEEGSTYVLDCYKCIFSQISASAVYYRTKHILFHDLEKKSPLCFYLKMKQKNSRLCTKRGIIVALNQLFSIHLYFVMSNIKMCFSHIVATTSLLKY